jgi:glycosyltransferase 2 family protein
MRGLDAGAARGKPVSRQILTIAAKYGLGLGLLAWVIWLNWAPDSPTGLKAALQGPVHVGPFLLAALCCACWLPLIFFRWYVLVRAQDLPFTLPNAMRLGLVAFFFNAFLPGSIGGDIVKAAFLAKEQSRRTWAIRLCTPASSCN